MSNVSAQYLIKFEIGKLLHKSDCYIANCLQIWQVFSKKKIVPLLNFVDTGSTSLTLYLSLDFENVSLPLETSSVNLCWLKYRYAIKNR